MGSIFGSSCTTLALASQPWVLYLFLWGSASETSGWSMGHVVVCSCQNKKNNSRWPGSTHDARIWARSEVRAYIETQRRFLVAGDSGYPISEVLIKPYTTDEAGRDPVKRLFNRRLSGLRTVMSENIFGVWKRRFPIINALRTDFELSRKIILATAILFNFGRCLMTKMKTS